MIFKLKLKTESLTSIIKTKRLNFFFFLLISRRIIVRKREIQKYQRRIGPNTQRITSILNLQLFVVAIAAFHSTFYFLLLYFLHITSQTTSTATKLLLDKKNKYKFRIRDTKKIIKLIHTNLYLISWTL